jgi:hypothetical protein
MLRPSALTLAALIALPLPALPDVSWRVLPSGVEAVARGGPVGLGLGCGNDGPGLWVEITDAEPGDRAFVITTDLGAGYATRGDCAGGVCLLDPGPQGMLPALVDDLRRGRSARVETAVEVEGAEPDWVELGAVPLRGSGRAIGQVLSRCPFR